MRRNGDNAYAPCSEILWRSSCATYDIGSFESMGAPSTDGNPRGGSASFHRTERDGQEPQYAPEPATVAFTVFTTISRSATIDQFST
jgi:hypothetical protein